MNRLRNLLMCLGPALFLVAGLAQAETPVWSDNFETNAGSHWGSTGVWKIGSPTAGPAVNSVGYRTHSGANCACTQGYGYNKNTRLICTSYNGASSLLVPSADQSPRLRFWHWFNFGNALGYVEISTNSGGGWIQISPTYEDLNSSGVWSRPYIDLTAYAGQNVEFAFHFTSGGCCGNGLGWFVDDVEVDTGTPALIFPEGFEFDPKTSDWSVDFGTWEIGRPTSGPGVAHTGTNCAATVLAGTYGNNVDSRLISPPFAVPAAGNAELRFSQWFSFDNARGFVEINNGITTITVTTTTTITTNSASSLNTNIYQLFGAAIPAYSNAFYWNPTLGGWTNATKTMGSVFDANYAQYYFEAGNTSLSNDFEAYDYRADGYQPLPQSANPTNYLIWHGMTWYSPLNAQDLPVGYFATNSSTTYTTNTTVTTNTSNWTQVSPTYTTTTGGVWTNTSLDLSAFAGQTVELAFHFTSGGIDTAEGWYVDDLSLAAAPLLFVPTNFTMYAGETLTATNYATNSLLPNAQYTYKLVSPPAHAVITNGVVTWQTSYNQPSSTNIITVLVTDNSVPPFSVTNSFTVTVINPFVLTVPPTQTIYAGQTLVVTNYATNDISSGDDITFELVSKALTNMDISDLPVDGVITWPTMSNQAVGTYTVTIAATDYTSPYYYSATNSFLVVVSKAPPPVLTVPPTQTIYAGQIMTVTNQATSVAFPGGPFTFALLSDPTGMDTSDLPSDGVLTWSSYPTNKSSAKTITIMVTDDQSGVTATKSFKVSILPTPGPTLLLPATQTNYAGMTLTVTNYATNAALSGAVFTFRLPSPSTNVCLTASGVLTWTNTGVRNGILVWTNNSVAPGTQVVTVAVDTATNGYPPKTALSATNHFNIVFVPPHPPCVIVPTNLAVYVGQTLTATNLATNNYVLLPNVSYAFKAVSTNVLVTTNGVMTWTNTARPGVFAISVKVTDNSVPPLTGTNNSQVITVLPWPSQLSLTNPAVQAQGGQAFAFAISTPWTNTAWRIEAATNLDTDATNWLPVYTNLTGPGGMLLFTDQLATNFLQRYYRAVFP
jgi:hypothetical protein